MLILAAVNMLDSRSREGARIEITNTTPTGIFINGRSREGARIEIAYLHGQAS